MQNRLKQLRKEKGLTLDDVQSQTGIKRGTYNNYENGTTEPKLETWQKLADFFNVPVPYLQGISDIKNLEQVSTLENFAASLEHFENGDIKVPIAEMSALAKGWQLKTFMNINQAILNEQNSELSQDNLKKYRKIVSKFDDKNLADMDGIIFDITHLYLIFLNSIQGKKKDKEAYNKIQKIIEHYLGIDNDDWMDDVPIHIHKERSNKENDNSNS